MRQIARPENRPAIGGLRSIHGAPKGESFATQDSAVYQHYGLLRRADRYHDKAAQAHPHRIEVPRDRRNDCQRCKDPDRGALVTRRLNVDCSCELALRGHATWRDPTKARRCFMEPCRPALSKCFIPPAEQSPISRQTQYTYERDRQPGDDATRVVLRDFVWHCRKTASSLTAGQPARGTKL